MVTAVVVAVGCFAPTGHAEGSAATSDNVIRFITKPASNRGQVVCALFDEKGWLVTPVIPGWAKIRDNTAVCVFTNVRPGVYGISAYHDENGNNKLDTNVVGMPTEDYGASRNARGTFGPPNFADAKFEYRGGHLRLTARLE